MSFNDSTTPIYHDAIRLMFSRKSVGDGMNELDAVVRHLVPHPIWSKLRQLGYDDELPQLAEWVERELSSQQEQVAILFFCLSDMGDSMSLILLRQEREPTAENDWEAYGEGLTSAVPSRILGQMYELAEAEISDGRGGYSNHDVRWVVETCYPLAYAGLAIAQIMHKLPADTLLGKDAKRKVAVFFGEGDEFFLGEITRQGFKYFAVPSFASQTE